MLDVKRLRVLKEVAEQGSFSAAADALSYTQSAVSQQIAALERETGTTLVERTPRGVHLTDGGRALVEHAEAIFCRLSAAEAELEAIAGLRGGRVRLASFPTAGATLVPLAIAIFSQEHPGIELSLLESEPEDVLPMLKAGEIDIALSFEYSTLPRCAPEGPTDGVEQIHLIDDPMYIAMPADHPLARKQRVKLEDFSTDAWIQGDCRGLCGAVHISACERAGFTPRVAFQSNDYNVVQGLIAAGVGVSLIPELALSNVRDDIAIRDLGRQAPMRKIVAATLSGGYRSPATDAMIATLQQAGERYRARGPIAAVA